MLKAFEVLKEFESYTNNNSVQVAVMKPILTAISRSCLESDNFKSYLRYKSIFYHKVEKFRKKYLKKN